MQTACFHAGCMASAIQIRNMPTDVHRMLKARAAAAGMSLSDFLLVELTAIARRPTLADLVARVESRARPARRIDSARAVRAERESRR
jgi:plasmid stability protein